MTAGEFKAAMEAKSYYFDGAGTPEERRMYSIVKHFADDLPLSDLMMKWLRENAKAENV